jgi:hypothetical protein
MKTFIYLLSRKGFLFFDMDFKRRENDLRKTGNNLPLFGLHSCSATENDCFVVVFFVSADLGIDVSFI